MKAKSILMLLASLLVFTGCDKMTTLFSGLEEHQANMVMAALRTEGIACQKESGDEGTWNVTIDDKKFAEAANLCEQQGLPPSKFHGVGEVFRKTGMISSPSEERIRFIEATSQDLSKTISMLDGVISARVHIVMPENDPFAKNATPSSASVVVRSRWNVDLSASIPQIKGVVKNAIEGLAYDKITVTIFQDQPPK